jgi:hypothetical protein
MTEDLRRARQLLLDRGFVPAGRESYPLFQNFIHDSELAEKTAVIATVWSASFNELYKITNGYLCTAWFFPGLPVYFELNRSVDCQYPLQDMIDELYGLAMEAGLPFLQLYAIDEQFLGEYESVRGYEIKTEYSDDHSEYVYPVKELLEVSGSVNFYKRKRLNKCFNNPDISIVHLTEKNIGVCLEVQNQWCAPKDCGVCASFAGCEKTALEIMTDTFDGRIHQGLLLYSGKTPTGYVICEKKNAKLAYLYFGKSIIQDYFVYLIYMIVKMYYTDVEYLNINEDMGSSGLRMFKSHLSVHEYWRKYACTYIEKKGERGI